MTESVTEPALASDGRIIGARAHRTRRRLLDATAKLLEERGALGLRVVDITREVGTSPATFYQYFPDVEAAIVVLAEEMAKQGRKFGEHVRATTWKGRVGYSACTELADQFITFWEEHQPVLRVVDLATEEGDGRFANVRVHLLNDLYNALAEAITEMKASGRHPAEVDPMATAGVLVSMLAHVAAHRYGFEFWGVRTSDLRTSMARIIFWSVTGQKPPS